MHRETLKQFAADAEDAAKSGDLAGARDRWAAALDLLPSHAAQHHSVASRIGELDALIASAQPTDRSSTPSERPWWKRGVPGLIAAGVLLASKLKFLLLGLTKASTFFSMFAFFGVYWSVHGWPLALGLVAGIYVHEMGHVAMLRRVGIRAGAPLFIPGVGAFVMLKQPVRDPIVNARIGLAGPVWGLGAAVAAAAVYTTTHVPVWLAIAELTAFLNLFNLVPVWQLDGSRGFHALARRERWALVVVIALVLIATRQRILFIVGGVAVWRALQAESGPGNSRIFATFAALIVALSWLARDIR